MLNPVTEDEKLQFTLKMQAQRGMDEILSELYESGYHGYADIWPVCVMEKKTCVRFEVVCKKVASAHSPPSHPDAIRFHVKPTKGIKRITPA